jgi:hypothetical protein
VTTTLVLLVALGFAWHIVNQVKNDIGPPFGRGYNLAIARFPDALILQFGIQEKYRDVPRGLKVQYVNWSLIVEQLLRKFATVIYANRRTAGQAIMIDPNITIREKILCIYKGFAICLSKSEKLIGDPIKLTFDSINKERDEFTTKLREQLSKGQVLVREKTDQEIALRKLYDQLKLPDTCIAPLSPEKDVLEEAITATAKPHEGTSLPTIGFVGGITERVISEKIGFHVVAEQPVVLPDYFEINSFVYSSPKTEIESKDLHYTLDEVEALWDETVRRIHSNPDVQVRFRAFLNEELRGHLGPKALKLLKEGEIFTSKDMEALLTRWLEFPTLGPVNLIRVAA